MKLVKVSKKFYQMCNTAGVGKQLLMNEKGRPCVLIARLKYKKQLRDFVIPLRSNIPGTADTSEFKSLPPNKSTRQGNRHGIHYIKMFPITKEYIEKFVYQNDPFLCNVKAIIDNDEKQIISAAQDYLLNYEKGHKHRFSVDIDELISLLDSSN